MLLSAALIVRNEERFLANCLSSILELVDDVVIVDTGSTDGTLEIARRFESRVFHFPWSNDFSAARNFGLDQVRSDWTLYIDADESVRPSDFCRLREALLNPQYIAGNVLLHPVLKCTPFRILRLFRRHPLIRFEGFIHENIWPGVMAYQEREGGEVYRTDLILDHQGYSGDQSVKHERNQPMLLRELERSPKRIYCWCHLADIHLALGREYEAVEAWRTAIGIVRAKRLLLPDDSLPYVCLLRFQMSKEASVEPWLSEARELFPANPQLIWLDARARMLCKDFDRAIALFEQLAAFGKNGDFERYLSYDERLLLALPYEGIATCYFRMNDYEASRAAYAAAAGFEPDNMEYRVKQSLCARLSAG